MNYRTFPLDDTNPTGFEEAVLFEIDEEEQAAPLISEREPSATLFGSESTRNNKSPRLIKRNLPRFQSEQNVNVVNRNVEWSLTYGHDWFHVMLRWPTHVSIFTLICVWTLLATLFAWVYQLIDARVPAKECGLGEPGEPIDYAGAFAFSLETCTTVGYGMPGGKNAFFENCPGLQVVIYFQMVFSMLFNAFLLAFFFSRLARSETRSNQMLFSNKAIIERRGGKWLFHARIYDLDAAKPVVEAHVRLYAVSWTSYERQTYQEIQPHLLHTMRLLQPNDELGAVMFTSIPATVTHHIDAYSPLAPAHLRDKVNIVERNGLALREVDRMVENIGGIPCPVCGETYGTFENVQRHIHYNKLVESNDNIPVKGSHQDPNLILPEHTQPFEMTEEDLKESLGDKEIMFVCEGIEPLVSGTFQALQSYKMEDVVFHGRFSPCMSQKDGNIFVDLDKFHEIVPLSPRMSIQNRKRYNSKPNNKI